MIRGVVGLLMRGGGVSVVRAVGAAAIVMLAAVLFLAGLGFGVAALYLALAAPLGAAAAAGIVAGCIVLAALVGALTARRLARAARPPDPISIGTDLVRRYPLESAAMALVAGIAMGGSEDLRRRVLGVLGELGEGGTGAGGFLGSR